MSFYPDVANDGGRDIIFRNHVHHQRRLKQVRPSIDNNLPRGYKLNPKVQRRGTPPVAALASSPLYLTPTPTGAATPMPDRGDRMLRTSTVQAEHPFLKGRASELKVQRRPASADPSSTMVASARGASALQPLRERTLPPPVALDTLDNLVSASAEHGHSRIAKFCLNQEQLFAYEQFVRMLSDFDKSEAMDMVCAAVKDAQDQKLLNMFPGLGGD